MAVHQHNGSPAFAGEPFSRLSLCLVSFSIANKNDYLICQLWKLFF
jgi:hypothetical protein